MVELDRAAARREDAPTPPEGLAARLAALRTDFARELWRLDPDEPWILRGLRVTAQLCVLTVRGFESDRLLLRASGLTYITALSVIPMLGVVIAILGMVGGNEALVDFAIVQLTTVAPEVRDVVRGYVENLNLSGFGTIGGAIVFGTAIFALRHLEQTLNDIWGVESSRSWARRFSDYLAVMVVAPITTGLAVSVATTLQNETMVGRLLEIPGFERIYGLGLSQTPLIMLFLGFTFLYWFFPNTTVRLRAAALGGLVAAVLFLVARTVYVKFQVGAATYEAVFGALSAVPLILAWLYACWAVVLLGAEVAFAAQNLGSARREIRAGVASPAHREAVAVELAVAVARAFRAQASPPTAEQLANDLVEPVRAVRRLLAELEQAGLLRFVLAREGEDWRVVPGRPIAELTVGDVLRVVRGQPGTESTPSPASSGRHDPKVQATLARLESAWGSIADGVSLESLLTQRPADPEETPV
jgi:membrane protein